MSIIGDEDMALKIKCLLQRVELKAMYEEDATKAIMRFIKNYKVIKQSDFENGMDIIREGKENG